MRFVYGDICSVSGCKTKEFDNIVSLNDFILETWELYREIGYEMRFDSYIPDKKLYIYNVNGIIRDGDWLVGRYHYEFLGIVESDIELKEMKYV